MKGSAYTQNQRVLEWLKVQPIDPLSSWKALGVYRLSARIFDLRSKGHPIKSRPLDVLNQYGECVRVSQYYLEGKEKEQ